MTSLNPTLLVILAAVAMSFGWGVRGTLLGHQKGATMAGAITGITIAFFSGLPLVAERYWIIGAAAMLGSYHGGIMSYMQTCDFIKGDGAQRNLAKGFAGCFIKGGVWIGMIGATTGLALAGTSVYKLYDYVLILFGFMLLRRLGRRLFDRPFDPKNGILPRFSFTKNKEDQWGGLFLGLLYILIYAACKADFVTVTMISVTVIGGGIGLNFGVMLCAATRDSKIFGRFQEKGYIDNWKICECSFGAIAGISLAIGFLLVKGRLPQAYPQIIAADLQTITVYVWAALILIYEIARHFAEKIWAQSTGTPELAVKGLYWVDMFKLREEYGEVSRAAPSVLIAKRIEFSYALYCYIPAFFVLAGSVEWAQMVLGPLFLFMFLHETVRTQLNEYKYLVLIIIAFTLLGAAGFLWQVFFGFVAWQLVVLYILTSLGLLILLWAFTGERILGKRYPKFPKKGVSLLDTYRSNATVFLYFLVTSAILLAFYLPTM